MIHRFHLQGHVVGRREVGFNGHVLSISVAAAFPVPLDGGHFFMLRSMDPDFPFLSRPFSIHSTRPTSEGSELDFLFRVVGPGTRRLSLLGPGDAVSVVGPLGCPFPAHDAAAGSTILVAGGVGLPPLRFYLQRLRERGAAERCLLLYGARTRADLFDFEQLGVLGVEIRTATEDGSHGMHGRVDALLLVTLAEREWKAARILTCGPDAMMKRVAEIAAERGVPCLASLETFMACGFGVCNACAVPVRADNAQGYRYARACIDGPVMDGARVLWGDS